MSIPRLSRRQLLRGSIPSAAAVVVGFAWARWTVADDDGTAGAANSYGPEPAKPDDGALAKLSDVPDGGGLVVEDADVVIVRDGQDVHAFSAICTHQGCVVSGVQDGSISCPCHGSVFDATTGDVTQGPATQPLEKIAVTVQGDEIIRSS